MNRTQIEWVRNPDGSQGYTWNPITGCLNGCPYCYARKLANGRLRTRYLANEEISAFGYRNYTRYKEALADPFYPRFWPERLEELRQRNKRLIEQGLDKPRGVFICDMGELFGDWLLDEWVCSILNEIDNKHDRFYTLTKQPQNLAKFSPFPDNCWVGVTATDQAMFQKGIDSLWMIDATIRYISFEPLLGEILTNWRELVNKRIGWVIIGAQTKPYKPPKLEWVKEIVEAADKAGIPVFLKDNLTPVLSGEEWAGKWVEHENQPKGEELWWHPRQEMPA